MRRSLVAVALVASAACSAPDVPRDATFASGSVLHAHFWDAGGANRLLLDWYDSRLDIHCRFRAAEDGEMHCLPQYVGELDSTDPGCGDRVLVLPPDGDVPAYTTSGERASGYRTDAPRAVTTLYVQGATGCIARTDTALWRTFDVTQVPPTTFVRADVRVTDAGDGFSIETLVAEDGTRELIGTLDAARGTGCNLLAQDARPDALGTEVRCFPPAESLSPYFADTTCTTPASSGDGTTGYAQRYLFDGECTPRHHRLFTLGAAVTSAYERDTAGTCTAVDTSMWTDPIHAVAAEIDVASLLPATLGKLGDGEVVATVYRSPGGALLGSSRGFWDTEAGAPCSAIAFADGNARCVLKETVRVAYSLFADAACTHALAFDTTCGSGFALAAGETVTDVWELGPVFTGTVYELRDGLCAPSTFATGDNLRTVGTRVDPDSVFARVTERTA